MPESILHAVLRGTALDLSSAEAAKASAQRLTSVLGDEGYEVFPQYDETNESARLQVQKTYHGNIQISYVTRDFLDSGDYAQLIKTAQVLQGLLTTGAYVKRGERNQAVTEFKDVMDWLLGEVKRALSIQRYKGLGEMNPEQLWETTMDPNVRRLLKVQIEDAIAADEIFTTLMGDQVEPRRAFIETNALGVRNLDV
jgi:DNA gyrase subunit B